MPSYVGSDLDTVVTAIVDLLADHDRSVPPYAVRDALVQLWQTRNPGLPVTQMSLDAAMVDAIIVGLVQQVTAPPAPTATTPAVWTGDVAGRLITALAMGVHCATMNLDQERLEVAQTLSAASAALIKVGSALRRAHGHEHQCLVLIDASTIDYTREAIEQTVDAISVGRWRIAGQNRIATLRLLTEAVALLDVPEHR
jgi:hypothetical protein